MAREEATFAVPFEIPRSVQARWTLKGYLESLVPQIGCYGQNGEDVGIGFVWETRTGLANGGLRVLSNRMTRALRSSGLISARAEPYYLIQRIRWIPEGTQEPGAIFTLKEG